MCLVIMKLMAQQGEKNNNLDSFESGVENMAQALLDSFHEIQPSENLIKSPEL